MGPCCDIHSPSLGLPHVWLDPLRDLQCALDTSLASSGFTHALSHTFAHT